MAASRRRRRPLFFYAVTVCVAGELAAIDVDIEALVLVFSLMGLFLCAWHVIVVEDACSEDRYLT